MATPATDLVSRPRDIDLLDSTDPTDRNLQVVYSNLGHAAQALREIKAFGAGNYPRPTHVAATNQAAYEANIDQALSDVANAVADLNILVHEI
jgi:hypothetical protein